MGAITLALAGCFSEPPGSGSGDGSSTTADGSSSSGTPVDDTTGSDVESTSGSGGTVDPDTGTGTTTMPIPPDEVVCDLDRPVDTGQVPADVVVIVGEESSVPNEFLQAFAAGTNVAVIAPAGITSALLPDVPEPCWDGCGVGCEPANRLLLPYDPKAFGGAFGAFLGSEYECIFRPPPPPPAMPTSGPSRQLWLFTQSPALTITKEIEIRLLTLGLRLHVACPGCDEPPKGWADTDLGRLVEQTQGSIGDSDGMLVGQRQTVIAPRTSCIWESEELPLALLIANGFAPPDEPFFVSDRDEAGFEACEEVFETKKGEEIFPMFFENDDGAVELCPVACRLAQLPEADGTQIYRCD